MKDIALIKKTLFFKVLFFIVLVFSSMSNCFAQNQGSINEFFQEKYFPFESKKGWNFISGSGYVFFDTYFDSIELELDGVTACDEGIIVHKNGKQGLVFTNRIKNSLEARFDSVKQVNCNLKYFQVYIGTDYTYKAGIYSDDGLILPIEYSEIEILNKNLFAVTITGQEWGVVDSNNNLVLATEYKSIKLIEGDRLFVSKENSPNIGKFIHIDNVPFFIGYYDTKNSLTAEVISLKGEVLIDTLKYRELFESERFYFVNDKAILSSFTPDNQKINQLGDVLHVFGKDNDNESTLYKIKDQLGYMLVNYSGDTIIQPGIYDDFRTAQGPHIYSRNTPFIEVHKKEKVGLISYDGTIILKPVYKSIRVEKENYYSNVKCVFAISEDTTIYLNETLDPISRKSYEKKFPKKYDGVSKSFYNILENDSKFLVDSLETFKIKYPEYINCKRPRSGYIPEFRSSDSSSRVQPLFYVTKKESKYFKSYFYDTLGQELFSLKGIVLDDHFTQNTILLENDNFWSVFNVENQKFLLKKIPKVKIKDVDERWLDRRKHYNLYTNPYIFLPKSFDGHEGSLIIYYDSKINQWILIDEGGVVITRIDNSGHEYSFYKFYPEHSYPSGIVFFKNINFDEYIVAKNPYEFKFVAIENENIKFLTEGTDFQEFNGYGDSTLYAMKYVKGKLTLTLFQNCGNVITDSIYTDITKIGSFSNNSFDSLYIATTIDNTKKILDKDFNQLKEYTFDDILFRDSIVIGVRLDKKSLIYYNSGFRPPLNYDFIQFTHNVVVCSKNDQIDVYSKRGESIVENGTLQSENNLFLKIKSENMIYWIGNTGELYKLIKQD